MLTTIAVIVGVLSVIGLWLNLCLIATKPGHISIIGDIGGKPIKIKPPGWNFIPWPEEQRLEIVSTERKNYNLPPTEVICTIDPISVRDLSLSTNGIATLKAEEISVIYQVSLGDKKLTDEEKLSRLNAYFETCEDGKWNETKIEEMLKDMVQRFFRDKVRGKGLLEAIATQHELISEVHKDIEKDCQDRHIPIRIVDLIMNRPMVPTEARILNALNNKSVARIELAAEEELQNLEEYRADRALEIKRKNAEAEKTAALIKAKAEKAVTLTKAEADAASIKMHAEAKKIEMATLAETMGVNKLPETSQAEFWRSLEALEAYKLMAANPSTKFVVSSVVMDEVRAIFNKITGGK